MLSKIDKILYNISPKFHTWAKTNFNNVKKRVHPKLNKQEFVRILKDDLKIQNGDVLFIHSSMRKLYLDFNKSEILSILQEITGKEGTLIFPCWQFNIRAEDYINENDPVFSYNDSPSVMGKISDFLRKNKNAVRSFHPTNSMIAIGKHAHELMEGHENDIYPCGEFSPLYKMMKYNAKIVGIGVTVDNLTFMHTIEDTIKDKFPLKTRMEKVFDCKCIDKNGNEKYVKTLVASKVISNRDVFGFFQKNVPPDICTSISRKKMNFFSTESTKLYEKLVSLALEDKTIYL